MNLRGNAVNRRRRLACLLLLTCLPVSLAAGSDATAADIPPLRHGRWLLVNPSLPLPQDLIQPAGRSLWDFTSLNRGVPYEETLRWNGSSVALSRDAGDTGGRLPRRLQVTGSQRHADAWQWLFPDHDAGQLRMGTSRQLTLLQDSGADRQASLWVETRIIGVGWLHLPSGPREVVLQEARVHRQTDAGDRSPSRLLWRWIDPRAGVVAWHEPPAGRAAAEDDPGTTALLVEATEGHTPMRLHVDEVEAPPFARITYGFDVARSSESPPQNAFIEDLAAGLPAGATVGDLIALDFWDFSVVTAGDVTQSMVTDQVTAAETCNFDECGYTLSGVNLDREDRDIFGNPNNPSLVTETIISHQITENEVRFADPGNPGVATDLTTWLRAATQNENRSSSGLLATDGENRLCYTSDGSGVRTPVPLWRYPNQDADGWYLQAGDPQWSSGIFQCEQNINNEQCGGGGLYSSLRVAGATTGQNCPYDGRQYGEIVKEGVLKLPSGHTFNALLVRNVAAFCIYSNDADCSGFLVKLDQARTVTYLWMVPHLGTSVRLQSEQESDQSCAGGDPDLCFSQVIATDIKFGLFPPLSLTVDAAATTETSVTVNWDPGLQTDRIDGFKVYWDTDSGGVTSYAFNSQTHPGQVAFDGNSATISGLTAGTDYFFTVTSLSNHTNPSSGVVTTYESLLYPTQVSGDPSFVYPVEVLATTPGGVCNAPEITGVQVTLIGGSTAEICWDSSSEPCVTEYQMAHSVDSDFTPSCTEVATASTCLQDADPLPAGNIDNIRYFLVRTLSPTVGTWGTWGSQGQMMERTNSCSP